jgi:hypothetical protein
MSFFLEQCPACDMRFMCPVGWAPKGAGEEVRILLRCGQCEAWRRVTVPMAVAQGLDRAYAAARREMEAAVRRLERERTPPRLSCTRGCHRRAPRPGWRSALASTWASTIERYGGRTCR